MCGGSCAKYPHHQRRQGLSPRVRGKRVVPQQRQAVVRSIPACAGEASPASPGRCRWWVYPRVCGGSAVTDGADGAGVGLSPRVRGKRGRHPRPPSATRSIPACAGEASPTGGAQSGGGVYPRVCGGSVVGIHARRPQRGLSPRVRGKREPARRHHPRPRSIPACAGEAPLRMAQTGTAWVYPRVCGGSAFPLLKAGVPTGLSPRVRGKPSTPSKCQRRRGSIPACAGEARMPAIAPS